MLAPKGFTGQNFSPKEGGDENGNGVFNVVVGPVASGTYTIEFVAPNGAGCGLAGGAPCDTNHAEGDFQSPGPFGTTTTIPIP